jgi:hypothetical protein
MTFIVFGFRLFFTALLKIIFFSVSYEPNDNFQYIMRFRKKNLTRPSLKIYMCPFKKKKVDSLVIEDNAKKINFMAVL